MRVLRIDLMLLLDSSQPTGVQSALVRNIVTRKTLKGGGVMTP